MDTNYQIRFRTVRYTFRFQDSEDDMALITEEVVGSKRCKNLQAAHRLINNVYTQKEVCGLRRDRSDHPKMFKSWKACRGTRPAPSLTSANPKLAA